MVPGARQPPDLQKHPQKGEPRCTPAVIISQFITQSRLAASTCRGEQGGTLHLVRAYGRHAKQRRVVAVATQPGSRTRRSRPREDDPVTVGVNEHQDPRPAAGLGTFMPDANLRRVLGRSVEIGLVEHHG